MTQILIPAAHTGISIGAGSAEALQLNSGYGSLTEANAKIVWRTPGTFSNIYCRVASNGATGVSTLKYRVGGANGNQSASIGIGATGEFTDAVNTDVAAAGNQIDLMFTNGGGASTNNLPLWSELFAPTTTGNTVNRLISGGQISDTSVGTNYFQTVTGLNSIGSNANTEANAQFKNQSTATLQNGFANVTTNLAAVATVKSRINGSSGNISVSITTGATGFFEDTTHTDSTSSGDLINYLLDATATSALTIQGMGCDYLTTNGNTHYVVGSAGNATSIPTSTTTFFGLAGNPTVNATESVLQTQAQIAFTASFLECFLITNTVSAASTLTFRKNAGAGNQTITITASTAGYYQDGTHTDTLLTTDEINYRMVTGGTGTSMIVGNIGILAGYGGGGTTYNDVISETSTATDSEIGTATDSATLSETGTSGDSATISASDAGFLTETGTSSDSYLGGKSTSDTLSESVTSSDSETGKSTSAGSLSETGISSDLISGVQTINGSMTETIISSDQFAGIANDKATISESDTASDSYAFASGAVYNDSLTETATATDLASGVQTVNGNATETIISSDQFAGIANDNVSLNESDSASDSYILQAGAIYNDFLTETANSSDNLTGNATDNGSLTENVAANDNYIDQNAVIMILPSGGAGDRRKKYLDWLKKKHTRQRIKSASLLKPEKLRELAALPKSTVQPPLDIQRFIDSALKEEKLANESLQIAKNYLVAVYEEMAIMEAAKENDDEAFFLMMG